MKIQKTTQRNITLQNSIFYILLIVVVVLLAQISLKTNMSSDWTKNSRHTLSETTIDFLSQLDQQVTIQAFISPDNQYHSALESILRRYQNHSNQLLVDYIDPDFSPTLVRELNIKQQAEIVVSRGEQQVHVFDLSEQSLTNALISVSRSKEQWLVFLEGHGERTPLGQENHNLNIWGQQLKQKGFNFLALDLVSQSQIPNNTAVIILASPERTLLDGEISLIKNYIDDGGNLLLLTDPNTQQFITPLTEQLNLEFTDGTVLDPNAELLGIADPRFTLVNDYANHPVGRAVKSVTLFPQASAINPIENNSEWQLTPLLRTQKSTWVHSGEIDDSLKQEFKFNSDVDTSGPLSIAYSLTRPVIKQGDKQQRIAVIGDSDFISNSYIGNGANLELGMALVNWLVGDDQLISIPVKTTVDAELNLSKTQSLIIGLGFLIVLPLVLFVTGFIIWRKRRQR